MIDLMQVSGELDTLTNIINMLMVITNVAGIKSSVSKGTSEFLLGLGSVRLLILEQFCSLVVS